MPADKQILEDLITAAFNDARTKADQAASKEMQSIQQGMGLPPGLNLPGHGVRATSGPAGQAAIAVAIGDLG